MKILLANPDKRIEQDGKREGRSKYLDRESELYKFLREVIGRINEKFTPSPERMDLHMEVCRARGLSEEDMRKQAHQVHEQEVDVTDMDNWDFVGRAFALKTPYVEGYGETHITVAFFRDNRPSLEELRSLVVPVITPRSEPEVTECAYLSNNEDVLNVFHFVGIASMVCVIVVSILGFRRIIKY